MRKFPIAPGPQSICRSWKSLLIRLARNQVTPRHDETSHQEAWNVSKWTRLGWAEWRTDMQRETILGKDNSPSAYSSSERMVEITLWWTRHNDSQRTLGFLRSEQTHSCDWKLEISMQGRDGQTLITRQAYEINWKQHNVFRKQSIIFMLSDHCFRYDSLTS